MPFTAKVKGASKKLTMSLADINKAKKKQAKNASKFALARGGEQLVYFWNAISKTQKLPNIQLLHQEIGHKVVEIVRSARGLSSE